MKVLPECRSSLQQQGFTFYIAASRICIKLLPKKCGKQKSSGIIFLFAQICQNPVEMVLFLERFDLGKRI